PAPPLPPRPAPQPGLAAAEDAHLRCFPLWLNEKLGDKLMGVVTALATVVGFALAFAIFFYLPILLFDLLNGWTGSALTDWKGTIEGVIKIIIFVVYILLVSRMRDIDRTFQYHGAEHKTIFCYENGLELTVENVKAQSRFHPRCGTSFIFVMLLLGIVLSTVASRLFPAIAEVRLLWLCLRLLVLLPIIVGLGYEFIRYAGRHDNRMVRILSAPGLWMQRLTTKEPREDGIIEVGIEALKAVITENPEDDAIK
ncbi:MAG: DUF1385 domain-containing protein, partial [Clostridiales bacterium]|nr:DUF1385 domain-containing protein [Clostridiales bacterium]